MPSIRAFSKSVFSGGTILIVSLFAANVLNFLFNAFLGRTLNFEQFGLVTLMVTMWNLYMIPLGSLSAAINYRTAFLMAHDGKPAGYGFYNETVRRAVYVVSILSVLWLFAAPLLGSFFHVTNYWVFWLFTPALLAGLLGFTTRGVLAGSVAFAHVGCIILFEALIKLVFGLLFVIFGFSNFTYLSIPLSAVTMSIVAMFLVRLHKKGVVPEKKPYSFPRRFFAASLMGGLAVIVFLSLDVILAKHYLPPEEAGKYAFLSLVGKMVFFLGSLLNSFVITLVARDEGKGKDPNKTFTTLLLGNMFLVTSAVVGLGFFGWFFIPFLFGAKAYAVIPYLSLYSVAIGLYTVTSFIVLYHQARRHYIFSFLSFVMSLVLCAGIVLYHDSISTITHILFWVSVFNFIAMVFLHVLQRNGKFFIRNLIDIFDAFRSDNTVSKPSSGKKRILVFNWRDTSHVYAGGAEVYIHEMAKRWVKMGHSVTLFCGNDGLHSRNENKDGIRIIRRGGFYFVYVWAFLYYIRQFRGKYDVIIDCQNGIPFFTPLYAKEPVYCVMHHVHQEVFRKHLSWILAKVAETLENRIMPWVYRDVRFIAVSNSTKREMEKLDIVGRGIEIIHNGVDLKQFIPGKKSKHPVIVYVGRLKYYKTINTFIHAAAVLIKDHPKAKFIIAGDGEERSGLSTLVTRLGLQDSVTFTGRISEEEKITVYQSAWVCVNPSFIEGWGITTIEANACGTPVVAADVPGLRDSVQDGVSGFLVPHGDFGAFAAVISQLITSTKTRKTVSTGAKKWASQFGWDKSAQMFLDLLNDSGSKPMFSRIDNRSTFPFSFS